MSRLFSTRDGDDGLPGPERRLAVVALVLGTLMAVVEKKRAKKRERNGKKK